MIKSDHGSPNVSRAKLMGQSERLCCVCFIVKGSFDFLWSPSMVSAPKVKLPASAIYPTFPLLLADLKNSIVYLLANCKQYCSHGCVSFFCRECRWGGLTPTRGVTTSRTGRARCSHPPCGGQARR